LNQTDADSGIPRPESRLPGFGITPWQGYLVGRQARWRTTAGHHRKSPEFPDRPCRRSPSSAFLWAAGARPTLSVNRYGLHRQYLLSVYGLHRKGDQHENVCRQFSGPAFGLCRRQRQKQKLLPIDDVEVDADHGKRTREADGTRDLAECRTQLHQRWGLSRRRCG